MGTQDGIPTTSGPSRGPAIGERPAVRFPLCQAVLVTSCNSMDKPYVHFSKRLSKVRHTLDVTHMPILCAYACYQCANVMWLDLGAGPGRDARQTIVLLDTGGLCPRLQAGSELLDDLQLPSIRLDQLLGEIG